MEQCRVREEHAQARALVGRLVDGEAVLGELSALLRDHFAFEEEVLLPLLASRLSATTGPVPVIRDEHVTIRELLDDLEADTDTEACARLQTVLLSHFEKEEGLLLPFARTHLSDAELVRLGCRAAPGADGKPACDTESHHG